MSDSIEITNVSKISNEELNLIFKEYSLKLADLTQEVMVKKDPVRLQMLYEALAYELGYVDGVACLLGSVHEDRIKTKNACIKSGKTSALQSHFTVCNVKDCTVAKQLDIEINGN